MAVMLITHDMGVIAETAQRVVVMYGAQVVEEGTGRWICSASRSILTPRACCARFRRIDLAATRRRRLEQIPGTVPTLRGNICRVAGSRRVADMPSRCISRTRLRCARCARGTKWPVSYDEHRRAQPLLRVRNLKKYFPIRGGRFLAWTARVHAVDDVSFDIIAGRDARPRRRVGLRQIDHRPRDPAVDRADVG